MAEVSSNRGVDQRRGPIGIGIVPVAVENHQPGALALDAVQRRAWSLGKGPGGHGDLHYGGDRPAKAVHHLGGLCLLLGSSLEVGAEAEGRRQESEQHHSQHHPSSKDADLP